MPAQPRPSLAHTAAEPPVSMAQHPRRTFGTRVVAKSVAVHRQWVRPTERTIGRHLLDQSHTASKCSSGATTTALRFAEISVCESGKCSQNLPSPFKLGGVAEGRATLF